ncbi:hypothetical protein Xcel_0582 [Xylanimonas cellulosilytica DSM 15894]|uniref:Uncharacterized protein n=1 Tax=Xylanimonas cellulosilytica (strain DSM 15894 / JCM 12276 / CECT 5975 / KCTC 9989 / LMG 20990 / NBRC 107835 / XIL07) TaxID=446471 RepID=D1BWN9_XYLCX|nr:hypothetical protein [Xylanimonas cellulosilytica]ACZ29621.1 hypothetical protein Xcel_0582 [Xylanimonas cellulosilytica DSM 15894]
MSTATGFTMIHGGRWYGYNQTGPKWRCNICGREGYGNDQGPYVWHKSCLRGHSPCPWCGRQLALRIDGTPRVHSRCPERPDDAELLRLVAAEVRHEARYAVRGPMTRQGSAILDRLTGEAS